MLGFYMWTISDKLYSFIMQHLINMLTGRGVCALPSSNHYEQRMHDLDLLTKTSATNYIMESVNRQLRAISLEYTFIREKKKVKEFFWHLYIFLIKIILKFSFNDLLTNVIRAFINITLMFYIYYCDMYFAITFKFATLPL